MRTLTRLSVPFILLSSTFASPTYAQQVELPQTVIDAAPVVVDLRRFTPGARVSVEAVRRDASGGAFRSTATFVVPADGIIDLARDAAVAGSYEGVDPSGLFWSMRYVPDKSDEPLGVTIRAFISDQEIARDYAAIAQLPDRVVVRPVPGFVGAQLFRPAGNARVGVIILLGGSEGGAGFGQRMGPLFAAQGFAALALPYYAPSWLPEALPGLPSAFVNIPVDRLEAVRTWIAVQDDLDRLRIGIHGVSKGGEFALIAGARMPWLRAVSAIVPSDVVWEGWGSDAADGTSSSFAWKGQPLPFVPYSGMGETIAALSRGERRTLTVPHLEGRRAAPGRAALARIPVERFRGALLIAGGDRDPTWPSGEMVRAIAERRAKAGLPTIALSFAEAGHALANTGWAPLDYEGRPVAAKIDAEAQKRVHKEVLAFFHREIGKSQ